MVVLSQEDRVRHIPALLALLLALLFGGCSRGSKPFVVLYTSQDQFYAEPILNDFTAETGIEVRPVFDTESAKTAGLARRLNAERSNPQCDVFWSNEEMHTRLLVANGLVADQDWHATGSRTRRIVINTNLVSNDILPKTLLDLTNTVWRGRVALAFPLFGTTKSHFLALRQLWGEELWKEWCTGLIRNGAKVVDGNSVVVKLVGAGECAIGLTDSDDIAAGIKEGKPIRALDPAPECIAIPSTIALLRDAPHADAAKSLVNFLSKRETIQKLVAVSALESVDPKPSGVQLFAVDWPALLQDADHTLHLLELIFVRS
jgi:iron(III) transport system substrate-binding protein